MKFTHEELTQKLKTKRRYIAPDDYWKGKEAESKEDLETDGTILFSRRAFNSKIVLKNRFPDPYYAWEQVGRMWKIFKKRKSFQVISICSRSFELSKINAKLEGNKALTCLITQSGKCAIMQTSFLQFFNRNGGFDEIGILNGVESKDIIRNVPPCICLKRNGKLVGIIPQYMAKLTKKDFI